MGGTGNGDAPTRPEEWEDNEGADVGDNAHDGPSESDLKEQWQLDMRLLSWVKSQGLAEDHPRRIQAEEQVAESKRAWQDSRPRAATSSRMRWAEEALLKARKGMARMEQSIDDLDQWYETEREERQRSLHELRAKVKMREEHLAEIVRQAAEDVSPTCTQAPAPPMPLHDPGAELLRTAFDSLGQGIGPALEQIREATTEGSAVQQQVNGALAAVANLYGFLGDAVEKQQQHAQRQQDLWWQQQQRQRQTASWSEQRRWESQGQAGGPGTANFDISEDWARDRDDWNHWEDSQADGGYDDWGGRCPWSEGDWERDGRGPVWGQGERQGPIGAMRTEERRGGEEDGCMDTDEVRGPKWMRRASASNSDHGERSWKKGRREEDAPARAPACATAGGASTMDQPTAEGAGGPQAGQAGAASTPSGSGAGTATGGEAEALAARREDIVRQAGAEGIDTGGVPSLEEGRDALEAWAGRNLL